MLWVWLLLRLTWLPASTSQMPRSSTTTRECTLRAAGVAHSHLGTAAGVQLAGQEQGLRPSACGAVISLQCTAIALHE
jgi:hypothetical protein